jgi:catechol-2,3-dioxygenase
MPVAPSWVPTIEHVRIQRMDHVGIVVDDLAAATEFFVELGLELQG